jgi:hypothetical protein
LPPLLTNVRTCPATVLAAVMLYWRGMTIAVKAFAGSFSAPALIWVDVRPMSWAAGIRTFSCRVNRTQQ